MIKSIQEALERIDETWLTFTISYDYLDSLSRKNKINADRILSNYMHRNRLVFENTKDASGNISGWKVHFKNAQQLAWFKKWARENIDPAFEV